MLKPDKRSRLYYACACGTKVFPRGRISVGVMGAITYLVEQMGPEKFAEMVSTFEEETMAAMRRLSSQPTAPAPFAAEA